MMLAAALLMLAAAPAPAPIDPIPDSLMQKAAPMDDARFWNIVERSGSTGNQDRQLATLRKILAALPVADLVAWQAAYDRKHAAAYSWDLWGAGFVLHGGMSDDGFDYFRSWLIAQGRRVYEAALADPDSLAAAIPAGTTEPAEFEEFGYAASALWAQRTGGDPARMPSGAAPPAQPSGTPWKEDEAVLAARYPKLWTRFGSAPLG